MEFKIRVGDYIKLVEEAEMELIAFFGIGVEDKFYKIREIYIDGDGEAVLVIREGKYQFELYCDAIEDYKKGRRWIF